MRITPLLIVLLLLSFGTMRAQEPTPIVTAVPFLSINPDARGAGMADCGVASEADVFSMYYNPAKYAFIKHQTSFGTSYYHWIMGKDHQFQIAAAQRLGSRSTLAASFRYHQGAQVDYFDHTGVLVDDYHPHELAADLAYSLRLNDCWSLGATGRYVRSYAFDTEVDPYHRVQTGQSFAADLGVYCHKPLNSIDAEYALGLAITNIGTKIYYGKNYWNGGHLLEYYIPTTLRIGGSLKKNFGKDHSLAAMVDVNKLLVPSIPTTTVEQSEVNVFQAMLQSFYDAPGGFKEELREVNYGIGVEYALKEQLFFRAGYYNQPYLKGNRKFLSFGSGWDFGKWGVDAAYHCSTTGSHSTDYLYVSGHVNL